MFNIFKRNRTEARPALRTKEKNRITAKVHHLLSRLSMSQTELTMIDSIIEMDELTARDIMMPRIDVETLSLSATQEEINNIVENSNFSRLPVYQGRLHPFPGAAGVPILPAIAGFEVGPQ